MSHYSNKPDIYPLQGGCPCGQTRYHITLPPILVHACHCLACQRQTGSSHALNAIIETEALQALPRASQELSAPNSTFAAATHASPLATKSSGEHERPKRLCVPSASGTGQTIVSCPLCRIPLWNHYAGAGPHTAFLRVGTLDRPWEIEPDVHIYTKYKRDYMQLADGKPAFEEYYEDRRVLYREDVLERVKALDEKVKTFKEHMQKATEMEGNNGA